MTELMTSLTGIFENIWLYGASFLLVLSLLVFVHEWGHYIVARMCGVRVEVFSIGFGKELFGRTDKNGTRWKFSLIPLGGYVKMFGDADPASAGHADSVKKDGEKPRKFTAAERKVAFFSQSVAKRSAIVFAGPAINFLFAILILGVLYVSYGKPETPAIITAVGVESAAEKAGFEPHDKVLEINGKKVYQFNDIQRTVTINLDDEMTFLVDRDGQEITLNVRPERKEITDRFGFTHDRGFLGVLGPGNGIDIGALETVNGRTLPEDEAARRQRVSNQLGREFTIGLKGDTDKNEFRVAPTRAQNESFTDPDSIFFNALVLNQGSVETVREFGVVGASVEAVKRTYQITTDSLYALWQIITGTRAATELGGIIRIGAIAGDMASQGFIALVTFAALLSINLGLINLFPIPLLDGGHLMFYGIEAAKGSPVSERVQDYAFRFGVVVLVGIMAFTNINDIFQLFK